MKWLIQCCMAGILALTSAVHARDIDRRSCVVLDTLGAEDWAITRAKGTQVDLCTDSVCATFDLATHIARTARRSHSKPAPDAAALFGVRCPKGHDSDFDPLPCPELAKKLGWSSTVATAAAGDHHIVVVEVAADGTRMHRYERKSLRHVDTAPLPEEGGEAPSVHWPTPTCALVKAGSASSSPAPDFLWCDGASVVPLTTDPLDGGFNHWAVVAGHLVGLTNEGELLRVHALPSGRVVRTSRDPAYAFVTSLAAAPGKLLGVDNRVILLSDPGHSRIIAIDPISGANPRTWSFDNCVLFEP